MKPVLEKQYDDNISSAFPTIKEGKVIKVVKILIDLWDIRSLKYANDEINPLSCWIADDNDLFRTS